MRLLIFLVFVTSAFAEFHYDDKLFRDHDDGECLTNLTVAANLNETWEKWWDQKWMKYGLYFPLSSKRAIYQMIAAYNVEHYHKDANKSDLLQKVKPHSYKINDEKINLKCFGDRSVNFKSVKVNETWGIRNVEPESLADQIGIHYKGDVNTIVWTDNKGYMLRVRCHDELKKRDWMLLSHTNNKVNNITLTAVKDQLAKLGFKTGKDHLHHVKYEHHPK